MPTAAHPASSPAATDPAPRYTLPEALARLDRGDAGGLLGVPDPQDPPALVRAWRLGCAEIWADLWNLPGVQACLEDLPPTTDAVDGLREEVARLSLLERATERSEAEASVATVLQRLDADAAAAGWTWPRIRVLVRTAQCWARVVATPGAWPVIDHAIARLEAFLTDHPVHVGARLALAALVNRTASHPDRSPDAREKAYRRSRQIGTGILQDHPDCHGAHLVLIASWCRAARAGFARQDVEAGGLALRTAWGHLDRIVAEYGIAIRPARLVLDLVVQDLSRWSPAERSDLSRRCEQAGRREPRPGARQALAGLRVQWLLAAADLTPVPARVDALHGEACRILADAGDHGDEVFGLDAAVAIDRQGAERLSDGCDDPLAAWTLRREAWRRIERILAAGPWTQDPEDWGAWLGRLAVDAADPDQARRLIDGVIARVLPVHPLATDLWLQTAHAAHRIGAPDVETTLLRQVLAEPGHRIPTHVLEPIGTTLVAADPSTALAVWTALAARLEPCATDTVGVCIRVHLAIAEAGPVDELATRIAAALDLLPEEPPTLNCTNDAGAARIPARAAGTGLEAIAQAAIGACQRHGAGHLPGVLLSRIDRRLTAWYRAWAALPARTVADTRAETVQPALALASKAVDLAEVRDLEALAERHAQAAIALADDECERDPSDPEPLGRWLDLVQKAWWNLLRQGRPAEVLQGADQVHACALRRWTALPPDLQLPWVACAIGELAHARARARQADGDQAGAVADYDAAVGWLQPHAVFTGSPGAMANLAEALFARARLQAAIDLEGDADTPFDPARTAGDRALGLSVLRSTAAMAGAPASIHRSLLHHLEVTAEWLSEQGSHVFAIPLWQEVAERALAVDDDLPTRQRAAHAWARQTAAQMAAGMRWEVEPTGIQALERIGVWEQEVPAASADLALARARLHHECARAADLAQRPVACLHHAQGAFQAARAGWTRDLGSLPAHLHFWGQVAEAWGRQCRRMGVPLQPLEQLQAAAREVDAWGEAAPGHAEPCLNIGILLRWVSADAHAAAGDHAQAAVAYRSAWERLEQETPCRDHHRRRIILACAAGRSAQHLADHPASQAWIRRARTALAAWHLCDDDEGDLEDAARKLEERIRVVEGGEAEGGDAPAR